MRRPLPYDPVSGAPPAGPGPGGPGGPGPPGPAVARRTWAQRLVLSVGVGLTMACLTASGFISFQAAKIADIERLPDIGGIVDVADDQPQNWLLVGSDNLANTRAGEGVGGNRTDTIMVVRVDPAGTQVDILSLHRDLWLPIAGTGRNDRLNAAYGNDETPERLIETIKLNFDIDIHHYVEIGFEMFKAIVEAVGGVPMFIERGLRDQATGLFLVDLGCVTLDGDQALAFARSRKLEYNIDGRWIDDLTADHGRISRQQFFMRQMFRQARDRAANPKVFNDLVSAANAYVKLDQDVDLDQAAAMLRRFSAFDPEAIRTYSLPTRDIRKGGALVLELVPEGVVPIINVFRGLDARDADPRLVTFSILNGSGVAGQEGQVQAAYRAVGYRAEVAGAAPQPLPRTTVRYGTGAEALASQVERHLTAGADLVADETLGAGEVVLVTGADLTTVMRRPRPWAPPPAPAGPPSTTAPEGRNGRPTTTAAPEPEQPHNTGDSVVGVVPGAPPPGVECP